MSRLKIRYLWKKIKSRICESSKYFQKDCNRNVKNHFSNYGFENETGSKSRTLS
jgi:hypothetical protein